MEDHGLSKMLELFPTLREFKALKEIVTNVDTKLDRLLAQRLPPWIVIASATVLGPTLAVLAEHLKL